MASFIIEGGHKLNGTITPQGAKNEVLQEICATLLTSEKVTIENIPDIAICRLTASDVVRHALVQQIIAAYESGEKKLPPQKTFYRKKDNK